MLFRTSWTWPPTVGSNVMMGFIELRPRHRGPAHRSSRFAGAEGLESASEYIEAETGKAGSTRRGEGRPKMRFCRAALADDHDGAPEIGADGLNGMACPLLLPRSI